MAKRKREYVLPGLILDRTSGVPLYLQVYEGVRRAILENRLRPGEQLPPTRDFAAALGISRTSVLLAFDHLFSEGYIEGRTGSGTFVSKTIPEDLLEVCTETPVPRARAARPPALSGRGRRMAETARFCRLMRVNLRPLRPGLPALREFPASLWSKIMARQAKTLDPEWFGYGNPGGYAPLREALADYLRISRAVRCDADQIIITNGSQQAIDLVCRVLLDPGDAVWMEEPGYSGFREPAEASGVTIIPVPVDARGLVVDAGRKLGRKARLAYVTPSHQYPLGMTMSLARRIELLDWAANAGAWILEDDYDSEYRYTGHPISSLQGLDRHGCVIYMGTFSKVLFPGLSLGYLVLPPNLVDPFLAVRTLSERASPILEQAALAEFINEGHFARHIRQMRMLYEARRQVLLDAIREYLSGAVSFCPAETGLQLSVYLNEGDDQEISGHATAHQLDIRPLSIYYADPANIRSGIVFGYAAFNETEIRQCIQTLAMLLAN